MSPTNETKTYQGRVTYLCEHRPKGMTASERVAELLEWNELFQRAATLDAKGWK